MGAHRLEAVAPQAPDGVASRHRLHRPGRGRCIVKAGQLVGDPFESDMHVLASFQARSQPAVRRHAPHHDQVLAHLTIGIGHLGDPQVHVGGEASVELHLASTGRGSALLGAEVEEPQIDGLLDLVDPVAEEEQRRGVGLDRRRGADVADHPGTTTRRPSTSPRARRR